MAWLPKEVAESIVDPKKFFESGIAEKLLEQAESSGWQYTFCGRQMGKSWMRQEHFEVFNAATEAKDEHDRNEGLREITGNAKWRFE